MAGNMRISLDFDTKKAQQSAKAFKSTVDGLSSETKKAMQNASSDKLEQEMQKTAKAIDEARKALAMLNAEKANKTSAIKDAQKDVKTYTAALKEAERIYDKSVAAKSKRGSSVTDEEVARNKADIGWAEKHLTDAENKVESLQGSLGNTENQIGAVKQLIGELGADYKELGGAAKTAAKEEATAEQEAAARAEELRANIRNLASEVGGALVSAFSAGAGAVKTLGSVMVRSLVSLNKGGVKAVTGVIKGVQKLGASLKQNMLSFTKIFAKVGSMIKYRVVRKLMSGLFSGFNEGLQNLVRYSSAAMDAMSSFKTDSLYLKNQLAATFAPVLNAVATAFRFIADAAASAMQAISRFFALIGGSSKYIKAVRFTQDYADSLKNAGGGAGDLNNQLMGFDKINRLDDKGGGGGSSYSIEDIQDMFETADIEETLANMYSLGKNLAASVAESLNSINWEQIRNKASEIGYSIIEYINGAISEDSLAEAIGTAIGNAFNILIGLKWDIDFGINWYGLGENVSTAINTALSNITPEDTRKWGETLVGKLHVAVDFVTGMVRTLDFESVGEALRDALTGAIDRFFGNSSQETVINPKRPIPIALDDDNIIEGVNDTVTKSNGAGIANRIAEIISRTINGAFTLVNIVLDSESLTTIGEKLQAELMNCVSNINSEEIGAAIGGVFTFAFTNITRFLTLEPADVDRVSTSIATIINTALSELDQNVDFEDGVAAITSGIGVLTQTVEKIDTTTLSSVLGKLITSAVNGAGEVIGSLAKLAIAVGKKLIDALKEWYRAGGMTQLFQTIGGFFTGSSLGKINPEIEVGDVKLDKTEDEFIGLISTAILALLGLTGAGGSIFKMVGGALTLLLGVELLSDLDGGDGGEKPPVVTEGGELNKERLDAMFKYSNTITHMEYLIKGGGESKQTDVKGFRNKDWTLNNTNNLKSAQDLIDAYSKLADLYYSGEATEQELIAAYTDYADALNRAERDKANAEKGREYKLNGDDYYAYMYGTMGGADEFSDALSDAWYSLLEAQKNPEKYGEQGLADAYAAFEQLMVEARENRSANETAYNQRKAQEEAEQEAKWKAEAEHKAAITHQYDGTGTGDPKNNPFYSNVHAKQKDTYTTREAMANEFASLDYIKKFMESENFQREYNAANGTGDGGLVDSMENLMGVFMDYENAQGASAGEIELAASELVDAFDEFRAEAMRLYNGGNNGGATQSTGGGLFGNFTNVTFKTINSISKLFGETKGGFGDMLTQEQADTITTRAGAIKTAFEGLKSSLGNGGSVSVSLSSKFSNSFASTVKKLLNKMIEGVNIAVNTGNVLIKKLREQTGWGVAFDNIPLFTKIPALANGAVIPANNEFLAVLGDQKQGTNIEAPLDTIVAAVMQAMNSSGMNAATVANAVKNGMRGMSIKVDGRVFGRIAADNINANREADGKLPLNL